MPPAPACPGGETGKGSLIPCCRRQFSFFRSASSSDPSSLPYSLLGSAHPASFPLIQSPTRPASIRTLSGTFVPVPVGVLNLLTGAAISESNCPATFRWPRVPPRPRSHPNSAISLQLKISSGCFLLCHSVVPQRLVHFAGRPQMMQQHRQLPRNCHNRPLLCVLAASRRPLCAPPLQVRVRRLLFKNAVRSLHQQLPQVHIPFFRNPQLRLPLA